MLTFNELWHHIVTLTAHFHFFIMNEKFTLKLIESGNEGGFEDRKYPGCPTYISADPYRGCEHNCVYCVAIHTTPEMDMSVEGKLDFVQKLKEKLLQLKESGKKAPIYLSPWTDAYQPAEEKLGITRAVLEMLVEIGFPFFIITKSDLVTRDLDIMSRDGVQCNVCISVISPDEEMRELLEPGTVSFDRRFAALAEISGKQIRTILKIDPIIPGITDSIEGFERLLSRAASANVQHVTAEILRLTPGLWSYMKKMLPAEKIQSIAAHYFPNGDLISEPSTGTTNNIYIPDEEKMELLTMVRDLAHKHGLTFSTCGYTTGIDLNEGMCLGLKFNHKL